MIEDTDDRAPGSNPNDGPPRAAQAPTSGFVPQFALDAADARISSWSGALIEAADAIDRVIGSESLPVPDAVRDLATSTTQKLRDLGTKASQQEAAELAAGLQRAAAAHPAASIGVGAAIGGALATLLVRLGTPANKGSPTGQSGRSGQASEATKPKA